MVAQNITRAVLRIAKVKTLASLDRLSRHDTRAQPVANDDPERGGVVWLTEATDPAAAVRAEVAGLDKPPRANAVLATQTVLTARAEWFGEGSARAERAEAFTAQAMAWARANLPGKIVAACRHDGEAAPHLHIYSMPIVETEVAVNRKRPELGKKRCRRLDYNGIYGNTVESRKRLSDLQTSIGLALAPLGIERGVPKAITNVRHRDYRAWKAEQEAAKQAAQAAETFARHVARSANEHEKAARADRDRAARSRQEAAAWSAGVEAWAAGELVAVSQDRQPVFAADLVPARRAEIARTIEPIWPRLAEWIELATAKVRAAMARAEAAASAILATAARLGPHFEAEARRQFAASHVRRDRGRGRERD